MYWRRTVVIACHHHFYQWPWFTYIHEQDIWTQRRRENTCGHWTVDSLVLRNATIGITKAIFECFPWTMERVFSFSVHSMWWNLSAFSLFATDIQTKIQTQMKCANIWIFTSGFLTAFSANVQSMSSIFRFQFPPQWWLFALSSCIHNSNRFGWVFHVSSEHFYGKSWK